MSILSNHFEIQVIREKSEEEKRKKIPAETKPSREKFDVEVSELLKFDETNNVKKDANRG